LNKKITPHAAVIIFNYEDRLGLSKDGDPIGVSETLVLQESVLSIQTSKQKSNPAGTFQLQLAPTHNWATRITPGSWVCILMTSVNTITEEDTSQANERSLKMVGRIESVRQTVAVDQNTGTRQTVFTVDGNDWGLIFGNSLYIDSALASTFGDNEISATLRLKAKNLLNGFDMGKDETRNMLTTSGMINLFLALWGSSLSDDPINSQDVKKLIDQALLKPENIYQLPKELISFLQLGTSNEKIGDAITLIAGKLDGLDSYTETDESFTTIQQETLFGNHTLWQLITSHSNQYLNETLCDTVWRDGSCKLALYKRIKPFSIEKSSRMPDDLKSKFTDIKYCDLERDSILTINIGTNWSDRVNFVEVLPTLNIAKLRGYTAQIKLRSQVFDKMSIQRDGFKPMIVRSRFLPFASTADTQINAYEKITEWKYALEEWFFTTNLMFNGTAVVVGLDEHISVGSNIRIPIGALGYGTVNANQDADSFILAHVESVEHEFQVTESGARHYTTNIRFVRGIIVDKSNNIISSSGGSLDAKRSDNTSTKNNNTLGGDDV
jgi:hypothetical protein